MGIIIMCIKNCNASYAGIAVTNLLMCIEGLRGNHGTLSYARDKIIH